jgi:hypothetical protein
MLKQRRFADANHLRFRFIAVGHKTALKPCRTAGDIGKGFGDPAAGAGLRRGHRRAARFQRLPHLLAQLH